MVELALERQRFEELRHELEATSKGKWALIRDSDFVGVFGSFDEAAREAVRRFGRGPYLIREIGAPDAPLPASVVYRALQDGDDGGDPPLDTDPIIAGLLKRLPKSGEVWPEGQRKLWLQLLEGSFKLIYKDEPGHGRLW